MDTAVAPRDAPGSRSRPLMLVAGALAIVALVGWIYRDAARSYFFNDDFQWLQAARDFAPGNIVRLERYNHFYRPVIEIYFWAGRALFGCNALPFHLVSIGIHLVNTMLLFLFARGLMRAGGAARTRADGFAGLAALFFAVQPGHAQAVAWVGAITDLLPATWYLLALWMWLLFLEHRRLAFYGVSMVAFALCLLTHEVSATLLAIMMALDVTLIWERRDGVTTRLVMQRIARYLPFIALLGCSLAITYVVNSRSYLVREGHYQVGWHAVPHAIDYVITLFVGTRGILSQVLVAAGMLALVLFGTPRVRFFALWTIVTIAPASFFTWGNVSRYLYLPAAGFSMLLAAGVVALRDVVRRRTSRPVARTIAVAVALVLAVRFAVFAQKVPAGFREWTRPYERYVAAVRRATAAAPSGSTVVAVEAADVAGVQLLYRDPAAEVASCGADLHVVVR